MNFPPQQQHSGRDGGYSGTLDLLRIEIRYASTDTLLLLPLSRLPLMAAVPFFVRFPSTLLPAAAAASHAPKSRQVGQGCCGGVSPGGRGITPCLAEMRPHLVRWRSVHTAGNKAPINPLTKAASGWTSPYSRPLPKHNKKEDILSQQHPMRPLFGKKAKKAPWKWGARCTG